MNAPTAVQHLIPEVNQRPVPQALIDALKSHFGDRCSTALVVREQHGRDESSFALPPPAAVVFAENTAEVAAPRVYFALIVQTGNRGLAASTESGKDCDKQAGFLDLPRARGI